MWVYRRRRRPHPHDPAADVEVWEVGFFLPHGEWECLSTPKFDYEAAALVCYLNGGAEPAGGWSL